ncbi:MAG: oligoribonuclease [Pseudomonadota bacterium]
MFWLDLEMTGLDEKNCRILEVAAVVTDLDLNPIEELNRVVRQPSELLAAMDEWCKKTHGASGLTAEVSNGVELSVVESEMVALGKKYFGAEKIVLCGNSISQDRRFVDAYLPEFAKLLHYRLIDISSFKEVYRNKYGIEFVKKDTHRARADILESIAELKHYLSFVRLS